MKYSILLVRASTLQQEIATQISELTDYARQFTKDELIIIGDAGASAIKEDEQFQRNMREVFATIENGGVECVYVWEISRIARREETLFAFKNFLVSHSVNLRVKNPSLQLLDADGLVNAGCELAFSLFATMAKQEMALKKERFLRGKQRLRAAGLYTGSPLPWGYKKGPNKSIVIDEEKAELVRRIFNLYATTSMSFQQIAALLVDEGYWTDVAGARTTVATIVHRHAYTGSKKGFPQIITKELWETCDCKNKHRHNLPRERTRYKLYAHGLIYGMLPDGTFQPLKIHRSCNAYDCRSKKFVVNLDAVDRLTVELLQYALDHADNREIAKQRTQRTKAIDRQLSNNEKELQRLEKKELDLEEKYLAGKISHFDRLKDMLVSQRTTLNEQQATLSLEKQNLQQPLHRLNLYELSADEIIAEVKRHVARVIIHYLGADRHEKQSPRAVDIVFSDEGLDSVTVMADFRKRRFYFINEPNVWHYTHHLPQAEVPAGKFV